MTAPAGDVPTHRRPIRWGIVGVLSVLGGAAFWLANFAVSRTPIAAEYRAALSIAYLPMLVEALAGGLILGFGTSLVLVRFSDRLPGRDAFRKAIFVSLVALVLVTLLIEVPARLPGGVDAVRYLAIGTAFNAIRILALGAAIGVVANWVDRKGRRDVEKA